MGVFARLITDQKELDAILRGEPILQAATIDSLTMMHLVAELEKEFSIRFDLHAIEKSFETIHTLAEAVEKRTV
jgi:acyl carrier protein